MGNINIMVDIFVLVILTGLSVSDIRNKKVSRKVLTLWGILTVFWKIVDFYQIRVFLKKMEQTNVENLVGICAGIGVGVLFLLASKVTEEAIGYGDGWMICILGTFLGISDLLEVLAAAWLLLSVTAMICLVKKKWSRKTAFPLVPFLMTGYVFVVASRYL